MRNHPTHLKPDLMQCNISKNFGPDRFFIQGFYTRKFYLVLNVNKILTRKDNIKCYIKFWRAIKRNYKLKIGFKKY